MLSFEVLASGLPSAALFLPFRFQEVFKEGRGIKGGKEHSRRDEASMREKALKEGNFQIFQKLLKYLF